MDMRMNTTAGIVPSTIDENHNSQHHFGMTKGDKGVHAMKKAPLADITNDSSHHQVGISQEHLLPQITIPKPTSALFISPITSPVRTVINDSPQPCILPDGVINIDSKDTGRYLREPHLALPIYRSHFQRECMLMAEPGYMEHQPEITDGMRAILVDWLVDVHAKFNLRADTLYLTVNILDRFLEDQSVPRRKLQLVGMAAMLIASKYEEVYFPSVADFVHIADRTYSKEEVIAMEALILNVLKFNLTTPYSVTFLRRNMKALRACYTNDFSSVGYLANYLLELTLQDYAMIGFCPSEIAAAACVLAGRIVWEEAVWNKTMQFYSGDWDFESLLECEQNLSRLLEKEQDPDVKLTAIKRKYSSGKYGKVSTIAASVNIAICDVKMGDVEMDNSD